MPLPHRALPWDDARIAELDDGERAAVVRAWLERSAGERGAVRTFACCAYAGMALDVPAAPPFTVPRHPGADPFTARILWVIGQTCFNETSAASFLETCLAGADAPLARAAVCHLLRDEIRHARLGWMLLRALPPGAAARDRRLVPVLAEENRRGWRRAPRAAQTRRMTAHAVPPVADIEAAAERALRELILPGFDALLETTRATSAGARPEGPASRPARGRAERRGRRPGCAEPRRARASERGAKKR